MLRITTTVQGSRTRIALEGRLAGPWVDQLRACWLRAGAAGEPGVIQIHLADVGFIDADGKNLLRALYEQGAELTASSLLMRTILEEITRRTSSADGSGVPCKG